MESRKFLSKKAQCALRDWRNARVHARHHFARRSLRNKTHCARAALLSRSAISLLMLLDKIARPFAGCSRRVLQNFQDFLRRRVMNGGAQAGDMFVTQTCKWRMDRSDDQFETEPLQRQHFRIAKRLRNDWIP